MHPRTLIVTLVAAGALAAPAGASASTLTYEGDTLVLRAAPGEQNSVTLSADDGKLSISDLAGMSFPADRCTQLVEDHPARCEMPRTVRVELGDGADSGFAYGAAPMAPIAFFGGAGNDQLKGADRANVALHGDDGDDKLKSEDADATLSGGAGRDELIGGGGNDRLEGGDGDDVLHPDHYAATPGNDVVDGGPGIDLVEDWVDDSSRPQRAVSVTLDGQANDGRPGEADDVRDVEQVKTFVAGHWVMGDSSDRVESWAPVSQGPSTIDGRGGDDVLLSGNGVQTIDGGGGNDQIEAGFGDDTITGGPGRDTIAADFTGSQCGVLQSCTIPHGNDTVQARDGEADTIDCGIGNDRAVVDPQDTVNGCEQVEVGTVATAAAGAPGAGPAAGTPSGASPAAAGAKLAVTRRGLALALRRGLVVRVSGAAPGPIAVRALRGGRTVARGRGRVAAAGTATVTVRFTASARRALRNRRSAVLTVVAGNLRQIVTLQR